MTAAGTEGRRLTAVFVMEVDDLTGPMLAEWLSRGRGIAAIVTGRVKAERRLSLGAWRRRRRLRRALRTYLGGLPVPMLAVGGNADWDALAPQLAGCGADVLVCFGFPRLIPDRILALFPQGGVNLHPSLLPFYRGPDPLPHLLLDGALETHGGMTLHRMSSRFDEGDVLAQIRFGESLCASPAVFGAAASAAIRRLVSEVVPDICCGIVTGQAQPEGIFALAPVASGPIMVSPGWTSTKLRQVRRFVGRRLPLTVAVGGKTVVVAHRLARLGAPTGAPPKRTPLTVSFDLADGRFLHLTQNWLSRQIARRHREAMPTVGADGLEIRRFGVRPPGQAATSDG